MLVGRCVNRCSVNLILKKTSYDQFKEREGGIAQWMAYLLLNPAAPISILGISKIPTFLVKAHGHAFYLSELRKSCEKVVTVKARLWSLPLFCYNFVRIINGLISFKSF